MTSTQRSESTNMMVKNNFVNHTTVLHKFAKQMLKVIQRRRAAEAAEEYGGMVSVFRIVQIILRLDHMHSNIWYW